MSSADQRKATVLLLLIHCLIVASIVLCVCVGGGGIVGPCFVVHYLVSSFAIISLEKKDSW